MVLGPKLATVLVAALIALPLDRDHDGIFDGTDACPDLAEDPDGYKDDDGCPDIDNDGDEIPDVRDLCPNEAEDRDEFQDQDGCPDPDNDRDGVVDASDQCKDAPETFNGFADEDGCPDVPPDRTGQIGQVVFASRSAALSKEARRVLDDIAKRLKEHRTLRHVSLEGHTNEEGNTRAQLDLSRRRADAVRRYLLGKGIAPERLLTVAVGSKQPLQKGAPGNHRVDLIAIE
jgi:outer membrane protein OmpA-like peptidoglycan-associated protein